MKAIGYRNAGSIDRPDSLEFIDLPRPVASGHDVLVEVEAISVNPVDTKLRQGVSPASGEYRVLVGMPSVASWKWESRSRC